METRKLYYEDCHLSAFSARVVSCEPAEKGFEVTLDATAFYPEGGGQACDLGILGSARVLDVREKGEAVVHLCDRALEVGAMVEGNIDYARRFDLMQQHTGEHMVSGVIPAEDLPAIEAEVNAGIWQDLPLRCWYPAEEELPQVGYRTKKALPWPVRIVEVPGYDKCACCGIHVARTGEVGLVKLFTVISFRGGSRMEMACGKRALAMLNAAFDQNRQVSQAFSAKIWETGEAARRMNETLEQEKQRFSQLLRKQFENIAGNYVNHGNVLRFEEGLDSVQVRMLTDAIAEKCGGRAAVFSGTEETGYAYCLVTREGDLKQFGKEMTGALKGRGGCKPNFQQGRVSAAKEQIEAFFRSR